MVSLAESNEVLYVVNRPGNRPSHEGAAAVLDRSIELVRGGGFQKVLVLLRCSKEGWCRWRLAQKARRVATDRQTFVAVVLAGDESSFGMVEHFRNYRPSS